MRFFRDTAIPKILQDLGCQISGFTCAHVFIYAAQAHRSFSCQILKYFRYIFFSILLLGSSLASANDDYFDEMVSDLLRKKITDERIVVEPTYSSASKLSQIKENQDKIKAAIIEKFEPQYSSFTLRIEYNNGKFDTIVGKYNSFVELPVASRYIKFGEIIQASDLSTVKTSLDHIKKGYATEEKEVVGMQAKQYIKPGSMFRSSDLVSPAVIKMNDPVNITFSSGAINLKTVGIAMGNGAVGDMIKVRNESSGAVLLGQIVNKNTVQVGGE
jgi:flagella basal body P-ring formation protein FlgA